MGHHALGTGKRDILSVCRDILCCRVRSRHIYHSRRLLWRDGLLCFCGGLIRLGLLVALSKEWPEETLTNDTLNAVVALLTDAPIRAGDLLGLAHKAKIDEKDFFAAMYVLEKEGRARSRMIPHSKAPELKVLAWTRGEKCDTGVHVKKVQTEDDVMA